MNRSSFSLTYNPSYNSRRQSDTALQFAQLDMQKMKRAIMNLEETGSNLLSKVPGDLTKTVEVIIAQTQAISENAKQYQPKKIDNKFDQITDDLFATKRAIESDLIEAETPEQSTSFIDSFSEDIKTRLIKETESLETNLNVFIDTQLKALAKGDDEKITFTMPDLFPTQVLNAKSLKLPRPDSGPVNAEIVKQADDIDKLMKALAEEREAKKPAPPKHDPQLLIDTLNDDRISLMQLNNLLEVYQLEERVAPRKQKKEKVVITDESLLPADPKQYQEFKENTIKIAKQMDDELEESKRKALERVEKLRAQLLEQEARVAEFDEVIAALNEKITYLQFRADDVLEHKIEQTQDANLIIDGMKIYTNQLIKSQEAVMDRLEQQMHRIELSVPFTYDSK